MPETTAAKAYPDENRETESEITTENWEVLDPPTTPETTPEQAREPF